MSTTTSESTLKGKVNEVAGKIKQGAGEALNNQKLADSGAAQQIKGHAQQAWGSVQEAAHDTEERNRPGFEKTAHDVREKLTSAAAHVKESIKHEADSYKNRG